MITGIFVALSSAAIFLLLHVAIFHFLRPKRHFRSIVLTFLGVIPVYAVLFWVFSDSFAAHYFLNGLVIFLFLFLGYCQFYFIVDRSVSVRIMIEIEKSQGKSLTEEQIMGVYSLEGMMVRRLQHMEDGGYITRQSGAYMNTGKGSLEARLFAWLKDLLRVGLGG